MSAGSSTTVKIWDRTGDVHQLSMGAYGFLMCFWTAVGVMTSAVAAAFTADMNFGIFGFMGLFALTMGGVFVSQSARSAATAFAGYMLVAITLGMVLAPAVAMYTGATVAKVLALTSVTVFTLGLIGFVYPGSLAHWGRALFGGLLVLIGGQFMLIMAGWMGFSTGPALGIFEWGALILFSFYVVYDINCGMRLQRTHRNALAVAVAIYVDAINIFTSLLSIMGDD